MITVPFIPKKIDVADVNDGNRYNEGVISVEDYNRTIEGILQSNIDAEKALDIAANIDIVAVDGDGNLPITRTVTKDPTSGRITVTYTNVKGKTGLKGDSGNGIVSIAQTSAVGLRKTYTITYSDGKTTTFDVVDGAKGDSGNGIASIVKTSTSGLVDNYTVTYTDGTTFNYSVANGAKGDKGDTGNGILKTEKVSSVGLVDTFKITYTNNSTFTFTVTNGAKGDSGNAATLAVGTVKTIEPNLPAKVINVGTTAEAVFDFEIPQGKAGTGNGNTTVFVNNVETARVDVDSDIQTQIKAKANKTTAVAVTLIASGWSGGVQAVVVGGVTATNNIEVGLASSATLAEIDVATEAKLVATSQQADIVTITAFGTAPTVDLPITIFIFG